MDEYLPINKRPDFLEHMKMLKECSDYLVGQLGYIERVNKWYSYEFTTVFQRDNIEVRIVFESSTLSSIELVDTDILYDESRDLTNVEYISGFNQTSFEVVRNRLMEKERKK